jgi:hypothetical protein
VTGTRKSRQRPDHVRDKLLKRLPPTEGRAAAFDKLHVELAIATEKFEHQGDGGRRGVFEAIDAMFRYFTSRGIPPAALEPLMAISGAIVDAGRGVSSPIFEPVRGPGAPLTPVMELSFQGQLAVIAECCVRHRKAEGYRPYLEPGTILAARIVNKSKLPVTVTATEMREIREKVKQCKNSKSPEKIAYNELLSSRAAQEIPLAYAETLANHDWIIVPGGQLSV